MIAPIRNGFRIRKTEFVQRQFLKMLPQIRRQAELALRFFAHRSAGRIGGRGNRPGVSHLGPLGGSRA